MKYIKEIAAVLAGLVLLGLFFIAKGCGEEKKPDIIQIQDAPGALPVLAQNEIYKTNHPVNIPVAAPMKLYKEGEKTVKPPVSVISSTASSSSPVRPSSGD